MNETQAQKTNLRIALKDTLAGLPDEVRRAQSLAACSLVASTPEFSNASIVMLFLSMPDEIDTAALALKCWQAGKTVAVPKVSWDQKRMLPTEMTSLHADGMRTTGRGFREPIEGKPVPAGAIDLVIVPGLGFSTMGYRIGRGMGFYDRFLAQPDFIGRSCGLCFEEQLVDSLPVLAHDVPLSMLVTGCAIRRFASSYIGK